MKQIDRHLAEVTPPAHDRWDPAPVWSEWLPLGRIRGVGVPGARDAEADDLLQRFEALAHDWESETEFESSLARAVIHPAYQRIIGFGPPVVPLILKRLERQPNYWFWALSAITGQDPAEGETSLAGATEAWLQWGRSRGYVT